MLFKVPFHGGLFTASRDYLSNPYPSFTPLVASSANFRSDRARVCVSSLHSLWWNVPIHYKVDGPHASQVTVAVSLVPGTEGRWLQLVQRAKQASWTAELGPATTGQQTRNILPEWLISRRNETSTYRSSTENTYCSVMGHWSSAHSRRPLRRILSIGRVGR